MNNDMKDWKEEFDKEFKDPMEKKYGGNFALYCSFCSGEWREDIKNLIEKIISQTRRETLEEVREQAKKLLIPYEKFHKECMEGKTEICDGCASKVTYNAGIAEICKCSSF